MKVRVNTFGRCILSNGIEMEKGEEKIVEMTEEEFGRDNHQPELLKLKKIKPKK